MNSKMWKTLVLSVAALVVAVSAGTAVVWAVNDDDEPGTSQTIDAPGGTCLEGATECDDIPGGDGAAGGTCLEGSIECDDNPAAGGAAGGTCLVGTPDCNDTPGFLGDDS
jgi:hypothetical protein